MMKIDCFSANNFSPKWRLCDRLYMNQISNICSYHKLDPPPTVLYIFIRVMILFAIMFAIMLNCGPIGTSTSLNMWHVISSGTVSMFWSALSVLRHISSDDDISCRIFVINLSLYRTFRQYLFSLCASSWKCLFVC